ncbi:MAG TPA: hypothetical protein VM513_30910 [Kofleriaceae bacterium]|nr:hypothetical protein [Kofleriaceae bacterium]
MARGRLSSVSTHDCGPELTGTLDGDKLVYPKFTITRATKARAEELDKLAAAKRPAGNICERAVRCLHAFDPAADAPRPLRPDGVRAIPRGDGEHGRRGEASEAVAPACK